MTNEEKQLLLIDLCARLPYGVKVQRKAITALKNIVIVKNIEIATSKIIFDLETSPNLWIILPYLRPMSSMTPEEQIEYEKRVKVIQDIDRTLHWCDTPDSIEWLQKNHFDYHHMIEKGLALAALEGMYN